ncbi:MAG: bacteriohemerythrin [Deltaproteobacteria bacterium]|nr:MAG: bacteriohemerythrin [Deltaproteobacteria bacterium]
MGKIKWDDSLLIGVELIDEQHKKWIEHIHNVQVAIEARRGMPKIASTLDFLINYTQFHFSTEEKSMSETGYSGLEDHRAMHEELKGTLDNLIEDFTEEGVTEKLSEAIGTFLVNWLRNHIRVVDQAFASFLKEKRIELRG